MRDGAVHVAWHADAAEPDGIGFFRGYYHAVSTGGGAWTRTLLPAGGDDARKGRGQLWLALDSAGSPAVAYELQSNDPAAANNVAIMYWRCEASWCCRPRRRSPDRFGCTSLRSPAPRRSRWHPGPSRR